MNRRERAVANIDMAQAAIVAAMRVKADADVGDLLSGIIASARAGGIDNEYLARRLSIEIVVLVGGPMAHPLVGNAAVAVAKGQN